MHWTELPKCIATDALADFRKDFNISEADFDGSEWEETDYLEPDCEPDPEVNWEEMTYEVYRVTVGPRAFLFWVAFRNTSSDSDVYYWCEETSTENSRTT